MATAKSTPSAPDAEQTSAEAEVETPVAREAEVTPGVVVATGKSVVPDRSTRPIVVTAETQRLINVGAAFLGVSKRDFISAAVKHYLAARQDEIAEGAKAINAVFSA